MSVLWEEWVTVPCRSSSILAFFVSSFVFGRLFFASSCGCGCVMCWSKGVIVVVLFMNKRGK